MRRTLARSALFPGSFDPLTRGHLDLVERGLALFDSVTVAVAENIDKPAVSRLFSLEERVDLWRQSLDDRVPAAAGFEVCTFSGLAVDFCRQRGHDLMLRGLRNGSDFDYEFQMALTNRQISGVETVFLMPSPDHCFLSSTLIRDVAKHGGDVSAFVPDPVARALRERLEP